MRPDKFESGCDDTSHRSVTVADRAQAEWKMLQEAIEPAGQSISRCVRHACEKREETAKQAFGIAATGAALLLMQRMPGVTGKVLPFMQKNGFKLLAIPYGWQVCDVLQPSVDTWSHPKDASKNAFCMGDKAGRLIYETGFAAIAGGAGMATVGKGNLERVASYLSLRRDPSIVAATADSQAVPIIENRGIDEFIAKKDWSLADLPKQVQLSGRVFLPHTTDSDSAAEGDIRLRFSLSGKRLYTDILASPGQWIPADFFENQIASLYFADSRQGLLKISDKLSAWLQSYRGKTVTPEICERGPRVQYKLLESQRLDRKQLNEAAVEQLIAKLPDQLDFSGRCYFGAERPRVDPEPGSVWWKRPAGTKGQKLEGDWEPHVAVCGQWFPCKVGDNTIKAELRHFESERQSFDNAVCIRDAMHRGNFSFNRLVNDMTNKRTMHYILKSKKSDGF
ncbi:MAG TPA: hypothetical protein V6C86_09650 [Oculatellaceae cyanobacterium]